MSRTYRELPHYVSKKSLIQDFNEGFYRVFNCGVIFNSAAHYAKVAIAKQRGDSTGRTFLSEVIGIAPNGSPLGYKDWSRSRWAKQFANKARRINDKNIIASALIEMHDDILLDQEEAEKQCYFYEEALSLEDWFPDDNWPLGDDDDWLHYDEWENTL